jgi:hypothetical protein
MWNFLILRDDHIVRTSPWRYENKFGFVTDGCYVIVGDDYEV